MVEKKEEATKPVDRKTYLKKELLEYINEIQPKLKQKFSILRLWSSGAVRGSLKNYLEGDLKQEDRRLLREILVELKNEKVLYHIAGVWWARLQ